MTKRQFMEELRSSLEGNSITERDAGELKLL